MSKSKRRNYHMSPARRAALRKAQLASARKRRRRQIAGKVGGAALAFGGAMAAAQIARYTTNPREIGRDYRDIKKAVKNVKSRRAAKKATKAAAVIKPVKYKNMTWIG